MVLVDCKLISLLESEVTWPASQPGPTFHNIDSHDVKVDEHLFFLLLLLLLFLSLSEFEVTLLNPSKHG